MAPEIIQPTRSILIGTDRGDALTSQVVPFHPEHVPENVAADLSATHNIYTVQGLTEVEAYANDLLRLVEKARNPETTYIQEHECVEGCGPANHLHGSRKGLEPCCGGHEDCEA